MDFSFPSFTRASTDLPFEQPHQKSLLELVIEAKGRLGLVPQRKPEKRLPGASFSAFSDSDDDSEEGAHQAANSAAVTGAADTTAVLTTRTAWVPPSHLLDYFFSGPFMQSLLTLHGISASRAAAVLAPPLFTVRDVQLHPVVEAALCSALRGATLHSGGGGGAGRAPAAAYMSRFDSSSHSRGGRGRGGFHRGRGGSAGQGWRDDTAVEPPPLWEVAKLAQLKEAVFADAAMGGAARDAAHGRRDGGHDCHRNADAGTDDDEDEDEGRAASTTPPLLPEEATATPATTMTSAADSALAQRVLFRGLQQVGLPALLLGDHVLLSGPRGVGKRTAVLLAAAANVLTLGTSATIKEAHDDTEKSEAGESAGEQLGSGEEEEGRTRAGDGQEDRSVASLLAKEDITSEAAEQAEDRSASPKGKTSGSFDVKKDLYDEQQGVVPRALIVVSSYGEAVAAAQWLERVFGPEAFVPYTFQRDDCMLRPLLDQNRAVEQTQGHGLSVPAPSLQESNSVLWSCGRAYLAPPNAVEQLPFMTDATMTGVAAAATATTTQTTSNAVLAPVDPTQAGPVLGASDSVLGASDGPDLSELVALVQDTPLPAAILTNPAPPAEGSFAWEGSSQKNDRKRRRRSSSRRTISDDDETHNSKRRSSHHSRDRHRSHRHRAARDSDGDIEDGDDDDDRYADYRKQRSSHMSSRSSHHHRRRRRDSSTSSDAASVRYSSSSGDDGGGTRDRHCSSRRGQAKRHHGERGVGSREEGKKGEEDTDRQQGSRRRHHHHHHRHRRSRSGDRPRHDRRDDDERDSEDDSARDAVRRGHRHRHRHRRDHNSDVEERDETKTVAMMTGSSTTALSFPPPSTAAATGGSSTLPDNGSSHAAAVLPPAFPSTTALLPKQSDGATPPMGTVPENPNAWLPAVLRQRLPLLITTYHALQTAMAVVGGEATALPPLEHVRVAALLTLEKALAPPLKDTLSHVWWVSLVNALDVGCQFMTTADGNGEGVLGFLNSTVIPDAGEHLLHLAQRDTSIWALMDVQVYPVPVEAPKNNAGDGQEGRERRPKISGDDIDAAKLTHLFSLIVGNLANSPDDSIHNPKRDFTAAPAKGEVQEKVEDEKEGIFPSKSTSYRRRSGRVAVVCSNRREQSLVLTQLSQLFGDQSSSLRGGDALLTDAVDVFCRGEAETLVITDAQLADPRVLRELHHCPDVDFILHFSLPRSVMLRLEKAEVAEVLAQRGRAILGYSKPFCSRRWWKQDDLQQLSVLAPSKVTCLVMLTEHNMKGRVGTCVQELLSEMSER